MMRFILALAVPIFAAGIVVAGPLHEAVRSGEIDRVETLLAEGADPDEQGDHGETPLNVAILAGEEAVALVLLESGASVDARNTGGFTALHAAAYAGAPEIAATLLDRGADVDDQRNKAGVTPLSVAVEEGHAEVVKLLIDRGADIELAEQNGYTPLTRAHWRNREKMIELLQEAGARCQPVGIMGEPHYSNCMAGQK